MKISILLPVYNDTKNLINLVENINLLYGKKENIELNYFIINDGSNSSISTFFQNESNVTILDLKSNQGNQKAIYVGLSYLNDKNYEFDFLVIMDSDGEDNPKHIINLLNKAEQNKEKIIFASRSERKEGVLFKIFYFFYKIIFKILTGKKINFGNFSCMSKNIIKSIITLPMIDVHYPSAIIKSKFEYLTIPLEKGKRYDGKSSMDIINFILHAMKSLAVFNEQIITRFLIFSFMSIIICTLSIFLVVIYKMTEPLLLAGWSTNVVIGFSIIGLIFLFMFFSCLLVLINKNTFIQNSNYDYKDLIKEISKKK